jgi:hypothetical protein
LLAGWDTDGKPENGLELVALIDLATNRAVVLIQYGAGDDGRLEKAGTVSPTGQVTEFPLADLASNPCAYLGEKA